MNKKKLRLNVKGTFLDANHLKSGIPYTVVPVLFLFCQCFWALRDNHTATCLCPCPTWKCTHVGNCVFGAAPHVDVLVAGGRESSSVHMPRPVGWLIQI